MVYADAFASGGPSQLPCPLWTFHGGTITGTPPFGSGEASVTNMEIREPDSLSVAVGLTEFSDVLLKPQTIGNKALEVHSVVVFHGAIVAGGPVWICTDDTADPPKYEILGWGFALSDPLQSAWTLLWDDSDAPTSHAQRFKRRGQVWCVRAAPVYERDPADPPGRCAIVSSDYINKAASPSEPEAASGRGYYFHIVRTIEGDSVGPWDVQRNPASPHQAWVMAFDIWAPNTRPVYHVHSAIATEWTGEEDSQGVQVLMSTGDGKGLARFIHASLDDIDLDYSDPGNWTLTDNFHGVGTPVTDPDPYPVSTTSPQPVCAAFSPVERVMFWGADLGTETLFATRLPADAGEVQEAQFDHLYGWGTSVGTNNATGSVFNLTQPRPELTGGTANENPIVACYMEAEALAGQDRDADRVLYCPDSSEPNLWAQCGRPLDVAGGFTLRMYARDSGIDTDVDENYYYLLIDTALDGNGALPYPLAPQGSHLIDAPDELLRIYNFSLGTTTDWSVKLVGMMPVGNWDRFAARGQFNSGTGQFESDRRWPLCTPWADSSNWIALIANCEEKTLRIAVSIGGTVTNHEAGVDVNNVPHIAWTADSPVLIAVGYDSSVHKLYVGVSVGGDRVQVVPAGISFTPSAPFTELRFRGPSGGVSTSGEVCEFRWFGGMIDTTTALTNADMAEAFTDLSFLE